MTGPEVVVAPVPRGRPGRTHCGSWRYVRHGIDDSSSTTDVERIVCGRKPRHEGRHWSQRGYEWYSPSGRLVRLKVPAEARA